jgi:putative membrane protein
MLTQSDRARIEAAIKAAEAGTTGEIYCVVAGESSDYREVPLAWGAIAALGAPAVLLAAGIHVTAPDDFGGGWTAAQMTTAAEGAARAALSGAILLQCLLFAVVAIVVAIPPIRRFMTPRGLKRERVRRRAQEQFLAKNLQATRDRTGVLIYVSAKEHMAELIADEGIAAKVQNAAWEGAMARLVDGVRAGRAAEGFEDAISLCGAILAEHFPPREGDNPNELSDSVVVLD